MKINLIDLEKYPFYPNLLDFVESMRSFDIDQAIETLKKNLVKTTKDVEGEFWFHLVGTENEKGYFTNWDNSDEDIDENEIVGNWKYIKFQTDEVEIPQLVKDMFAPYLEKLKDFPYEIEIHSISHCSRIEDHVDKPGVPVGESANRNLLISLNYPKNLSPDQIGVHVDRKAFTPEDIPAFLFDSQYLHGAWNNTQDPWTFLVFYVPTEKIDPH